MILTILNAATHEPVLILTQDDTGIQAIGGNAQNIQRLGLDRFNNLQDIAAYINADGGQHLQAILDEKSVGKAKENTTQEDRLEGPLKVIKDLLARVEQRKKNQPAKDTDQDQSKKQDLNTIPDYSDMEVVAEKPTMVYVSYDGDSIGNAVARAEEKDDERELSQMSQRIEAGQKVAADWAINAGGVIIEQGGDEGLVKVPSTAVHRVEELREAYKNVVGATLTVGIGSKISESTKARMLGKLRGKNQVCQFDESTIQELELRLKDQDKTEANKIRTAMRGGGDFEGAAQSAPSAQQEQPAQADAAQPDSQAPSQESPSQPQQPQRTPKWAAPQEKQALPDDPAPELKEEAPQQPAQPLPFSKELHEAMGKSDEPKPKRSIRNHYNDPEIEGMDFSDSDDPEFSKALHYVARYGSGK